MTKMLTIEDFLGLGLSPRSAYLYARMLERAAPFLEARGAELETCTATDLAQLSGHFQGSYSQRQMLRSALVAAWRFLGRGDPPVRALRVPPRPRGRCRALSEKGAQRLEQAAWDLRATPAGLSVLIGLYTALRRCEIARMRWEDILDDEQGQPSWLRVRGKGHVEAEIPIHSSLAGVLAAQRRRAGWLFPGRRRGEPVNPSTVWQWVRLVSEAAGMPPVKTHVLRHTSLAEANDRSGNLRATQEFARHARIDTTVIYTRTAPERLRAIVEAIDYGRRTGGEDEAA